MAGQIYEQRWLFKVENLILDGDENGLVTIADTTGFYVKQQVSLFSSVVSPVQYEVKRVLTSSALLVGPIGGSIDQRSNISQFKVADGSSIMAAEQSRPNIRQEFLLRHVYAEEPAVALRVLPVDPQGNYVAGGGGAAGDINVAKWGNVATSLGQKPMGQSVPVVISSDQSPLPIEVNPGLDPINPQLDILPANSITATTPATANTLSVITIDRMMFTLKNSLNRTVWLTLNGNAWLELDANVNVSFDFASNGKKLVTGDIIGVYCTGIMPKLGSLSLTLI